MFEQNLIMVIDDDPVSINILKNCIGDQYIIISAYSGAQAIEMLNNGMTPDLVLLDIMMQIMDGYETFIKIREIERLANVPIIFLTGLTGNADEINSLNLGAQDFIRKPFVKEILLARIRLRIDNSNKVHQLQEVQVKSKMNYIDEEKFSSLTTILSSIEKEVTRLIVFGCSNHEIATRLHYSQGYINNIATIIYEKLNIRNRWELRKILTLNNE